MSKVLIEEQTLYDIADAIRGVNGAITTYKPGEMANAITDTKSNMDLIGLVFSNLDLASALTLESSMSITKNGGTIQTTWKGGQSIGCSISIPLFLIPGCQSLSYRVTFGDSYSKRNNNRGPAGTYANRFDLCIGTVSVANANSGLGGNSSFNTINVYSDNETGTTIDDSLDLSSLTKPSVLVISAHGWSSTWTDFVLR